VAVAEQAVMDRSNDAFLRGMPAGAAAVPNRFRSRLTTSLGFDIRNLSCCPAGPARELSVADARCGHAQPKAELETCTRLIAGGSDFDRSAYY